jgi:hypothetical protein
MSGFLNLADDLIGTSRAPALERKHDDGLLSVFSHSD